VPVETVSVEATFDGPLTTGGLVFAGAAVLVASPPAATTRAAIPAAASADFISLPVKRVSAFFAGPPRT
jgi:hypothetical protein